MNEDAKKLTVILLSCIWGIFGVLSLPPIMMSPMMFDSGSQANIRVLTSFWSLVTFPLVCAFSVLLSFFCVCFEKFGVAVLIILLPLINVYLFLWIMIIGW
jgi:hypothetical protein